MLEPLEQQMKQVRLLTVALELLRRQVTGDTAAFMFANRERGHESAEWTRGAIFHGSAAGEGRGPSEPDSGQTVPIPKTPGSPTVSPVLPAQIWSREKETWVDAPDKSPEKPPQIIPPVSSNIGAFGLSAPERPDVGHTTAFDRPQSVVIVGPNPLPVTMDLSAAMKKPEAVTPRGDRKGDEGGAGGIAKAIAGRFLAVLGPLYALSTILSQTNSGMGVFGKAVNVLGATLAPIILPFFAMLAVGILTLSDYIYSKLLPALGEFYDWALKFGLPVVQAKVENMADAVDTGTALKNLLSGEAPKMADLPRLGDSLLRNLDPTPFSALVMDHIGGGKDLADFGSRQMGYKSWADQSGKAGFAGSPEAQKEKEKFDFGARMSANMQDVIKSLAMSMGPKGSYASLGEAGKQAQLAALNADPIEMKAAQRVIESINEFKRAFEQSQNKNEPKNQINRREDEWRSQ